MKIQKETIYIYNTRYVDDKPPIKKTRRERREEERKRNKAK